MTADTFPLQVGRFSCLLVNDAQVSYPIGMFLTNPPPPEDRPRLGLNADASGQIECAYSCLLIDTGRERVLIDTGLGGDQGRLLEGLRARGIDERSIDVVVLTHLHPDHVGGVVRKDGGKAFPDARYVVGEREWRYWAAKPALDELPIDAGMKGWIRQAADACVSALQSSVDLIGAEAEIVPGISAVNAFGHSPGQLAIDVSSEGQQLLFLADVLILPIDVPYPEARGVSDHEPETMFATRLRLLELAAGRGCLVGTSHFPFPGLGRVRPAARRWTWEPHGSA